MKFVLVMFLCVLSTVACTAQQKNAPQPGKTDSAAVEAQKAAPALSDQQKAQIKDFQLADSQLDVQILRAQQQKAENQQRAQAYLATLCRSQDGKSYQVHFPDLSCVAVASPGQK